MISKCPLDKVSSTSASTTTPGTTGSPVTTQNDQITPTTGTTDTPTTTPPPLSSQSTTNPGIDTPPNPQKRPLPGENDEKDEKDGKDGNDRTNTKKAVRNAPKSPQTTTPHTKKPSHGKTNNDSSDDDHNMSDDSSGGDESDDDVVHLTKAIKSTGDVSLDIEALLPWIGSVIMPKDEKKPKAAVMRFLIAPQGDNCVVKNKMTKWDKTQNDKMAQFKQQFNFSSQNNQETTPVDDNATGNDDVDTKPKCCYDYQPKNEKTTTTNTVIPLPINSLAPPNLSIPICYPPDDDELPSFNVKFSQLAGIIQFKNAVVLFVNLDLTNYANQFAYLKPHFGLSYYGSPSQTYQTGVIKKILESIEGDIDRNNTVNTNNNTNVSTTTTPKPKLLLFVRDDSAQAKRKPKSGSVPGVKDAEVLHIGEKYVFWGTTSIHKHGFVKDRGITQGVTAQTQAQRNNDGDGANGNGKGKKLIQFLLKVDHFETLLKYSWPFYHQIQDLAVSKLSDTFRNDDIVVVDE